MRICYLKEPGAWLEGVPCVKVVGFSHVTILKERKRDLLSVIYRHPFVDL